MTQPDCPQPEPSRRVVRVNVSADLLAGLLFPSRPGEWWRTDYGLPQGAVCVNKWYEFAAERFVFVFAHDSFAEVPAGAPVPEFGTVTLTAMRCHDADSFEWKQVPLEAYPQAVRESFSLWLSDAPESTRLLAEGESYKAILDKQQALYDFDVCHAITVNEFRAVHGLAPVEGGDVPKPDFAGDLGAVITPDMLRYKNNHRKTTTRPGDSPKFDVKFPTGAPKHMEHIGGSFVSVPITDASVFADMLARINKKKASKPPDADPDAPHIVGGSS